MKDLIKVSISLEKFISHNQPDLVKDLLDQYNSDDIVQIWYYCKFFMSNKSINKPLSLEMKNLINDAMNKNIKNE